MKVNKPRKVSPSSNPTTSDPNYSDGDPISYLDPDTEEILYVRLINTLSEEQSTELARSGALIPKDRRSSVPPKVRRERIERALAMMSPRLRPTTAFHQVPSLQPDPSTRSSSQTSRTGPTRASSPSANETIAEGHVSRAASPDTTLNESASVPAHPGLAAPELPFTQLPSVQLPSIQLPSTTLPSASLSHASLSPAMSSPPNHMYEEALAYRYRYLVIRATELQNALPNMQWEERQQAEAEIRSLGHECNQMQEYIMRWRILASLGSPSHQ